jgi:hypothetical protein
MKIIKKIKIFFYTMCLRDVNEHHDKSYDLAKRFLKYKIYKLNL